LLRHVNIGLQTAEVAFEPACGWGEDIEEEAKELVGDISACGIKLWNGNGCFWKGEMGG
jgi:hypothetical protein